jgi:hypothetical protein
LRRIGEIEEAINRVDFSWEKGFLTPQEYVEKRNQFHREIESLRPVDYDDLIEAADLLEIFASYWEACATVENPDEARKQLLAKIVDRIFIYNDAVIAISLYGNYSVVLGSAGMAPDEIVDKIQSETKKAQTIPLVPLMPRAGATGLEPSLGTGMWCWFPPIKLASRSFTCLWLS